MATYTVNKSEWSRFDARLPKEQKRFFERAAQLGGYRSLTDFVISVVQEKAKKIVDESEQISLSPRDAELFFHAVTTPQPPNEALRQAAETYKTVVRR